MTNALALTGASSLDRYMLEVSRVPLLSREDEYDLARRLRDHADVSAAHQLVVSNLRFVVKIAHEYRGYGIPLVDLIQEGNIGLMRAVKKYDPDRGYRLITYAVWWIRAQIQSFIVKSWSLVKLGTGRLARRLFFKLRSTRSAIEQVTGETPSTTTIAERLGATEQHVSEMEARLAARDFHLDAAVTKDGKANHLELLSAGEPDQEDRISAREEREMLERALRHVTAELDAKERYILEHRLLDDEPEKLADIGARFGVSRQRVQQIESRVLCKIRDHVLNAPSPKRLPAG